MKTLKFSIHIAAPRQIVWNTLWNDETYRKWTSVFQEGSYAVSDWKEGSKIVFMTPVGEGMSSVIARKIPNEFMSFRHMEETPGNMTGALENYYLHEEDGITELKVEVDTAEDNVRYFESKFPLALKKIKELSEVPQPHQISVDTEDDW
jgi:uncharacterized protein YndB with AHSA1/START domain